MENKRYYWLKLQDDFFTSKRIKKLRRLAGGDTFTIIYLKMQLNSLKTDGILEFTGIEDTFAKEVALDIDEDEENVALTISYLLANGLLVESDGDYKLPYVELLTGSETASTQRTRECRKRQKMLQKVDNATTMQQICNNNATTMQQICNNNVTDVQRMCSVEIEKEKEIEIDIYNKRSRLTKPTLEEVKDYCEERKNNVDAQRWYDYYESNGWKVGKNSMKDWKACVRTWESNSYGNSKITYKYEEISTDEQDIDKLKKELFGNEEE